MDWIKVCIYTSSQGIDTVCAKLDDIGITGVQIDDAAEFDEFMEQNKKYWDYVDEQLEKQMHGETKVTFYIENNDNYKETLKNIEQMLEGIKKTDTEQSMGKLSYITDCVNDEDWANNWKKYFKPIEVGEKILIQPEWEKHSEKTDRTVFTVNPGMTFGTGTHSSTKLCIRALEKVITPQTDMLDIGCGSGILSIISLLLGAKSAIGIDIDENSKHTAYENAKMNSVDKSKYTVYTGDILTDKLLFEKISQKKYSVIAANIVADVIIALLPTVKKLIMPGGTFICSGIINERLNDVLDAVKLNSIKVSYVEKDGEWSSVVCGF